jgi:hypothetical protein
MTMVVVYLILAAPAYAQAQGGSPLGKRCERPHNGIHYDDRPRSIPCLDRRRRAHIRLLSINANIGDSLDLVVQLERKSGTFPRYCRCEATIWSGMSSVWSATIVLT